MGPNRLPVLDGPWEGRPHTGGKSAAALSSYALENLRQNSGMVLDESADDSLVNRAATLVTAANAVAVSSFTAFLDDSPWLKDIDLKDWDFFITVAGVFVGLTKLNKVQLPADRLDQLFDIIAKQLDAFHKNGGAAVDDCTAFYDRGMDDPAILDSYSRDQARFISADIIGMWLCWNLLRHAPEQTREHELARRLGIIVTQGFSNWWD